MDTLSIHCVIPATCQSSEAHAEISRTAATTSPALFLDRDGVINVDHGYVHNMDQFEFIDGIFDLCKAAKARGYRIIVITNQAGIARGYYTEEDFHVLTDWMQQQFDANGIAVDAVYYSPYHPEHGIGQYKQESTCRKPAPGMILQAQKTLNLDLKDSVLIGDKESDIEAGIRAGVGTNLLFQSSKGKHYPTSMKLQVINTIPDAIDYLVCSDSAI